MSFTLDTVVPWGRSYEEYIHMFNLTDTDLNKRILGCADGPASFNAQLSQRGGHVVSVDPIYGFDADQISTRIAETYEIVIAQTCQNQDQYVWNHIANVEELGAVRMEAMRTFLADYETGKREGRYIKGELPTLPFSDQSFDLALCSHFLFLYSEHFSAEFHKNAFQELLRVANEVRVFPLLTLKNQQSPHLADVLDALSNKRFNLEIRSVGYEFQRGANLMLVIHNR